MAPSSGSALVPAALRLARQAIQKAQTFVRSKLPESTRALGGELQPIRIRHAPTHPLHRIAYLRQSKGRWYTTRSSINATIRRYPSARPSVPSSRASLPKSTISNAANRLTSHAPFASTLRPNLTGGALPRTSGGYSIGAGRHGGVRHFSHTPAAPAQVVQNVSTAMRAFLLSGKTAQYDGRDPSGQPRFKSVSTLQSTTSQKLRSLPAPTPGTSLDFAVTPTITALSPLSSLQPATTLQSSAVLSELSIDFARALKDLSLILSDLQRLSVLGDLQLSMPDRSTLRVHFPGCDQQTVERLCSEFDIQRGLIRQDAAFDAHTGAELALLFPFAPSATSSSSGVDRDPIDWQTMLSPGYSHCSDTGTDTGFERLSSHHCPGTDTEGYASVYASDASDDAGMYFHALSRVEAHPASGVPTASPTSAEEYEGLEGIHRFLAECDGARRPGGMGCVS